MTPRAPVVWSGNRARDEERFAVCERVRVGDMNTVVVISDEALEDHEAAEIRRAAEAKLRGLADEGRLGAEVLVTSEDIGG